MTRLIKLIMVAAIVVASVAQAQIYNENYMGTTEPDPKAYVTSNGVEWVQDTGLTISNSAAVFMYTNTNVIVTNALVEFTVIPVLNDAIPTDVDGASVVFWVNTDSNVCRLVNGGSTDTNTTVNVISTGTGTEGAVAFSVTNNYFTKKFYLVANGDLIFNNVGFYDTSATNLTQLEIRETSDTDVAVVEIFEVQELDDNGEPTAADDISLKAYEKGGKVYVELEVSTNGASTSFKVYRDGVLIGEIEYVDGQSVYTIEDAGAVVGQTYNYSVTDYEASGPVGEFDLDIKVLPVLEAKALQMTQTQMTLTFASVPGETYKVVGLTALSDDGISSIVADDIGADADSYETSVLVEIGDNFYFKIIKK